MALRIKIILLFIPYMVINTLAYGLMSVPTLLKDARRDWVSAKM